MTWITAPYRLAILAKPVVRVPPPFPLYVDTVAGNDSWIGTKDKPLLNPNTAFAKVVGYDWHVCIKAPDTTASVRTAWTHDSTATLMVTGWDDEPWYTYASDTITGGFTGSGPVYSITLGWTALRLLYVKSRLELVGDRMFHPKMRYNTTTPTTPAQGEFGYDNGILYVRMSDDSNPNTHVFEAARRNFCMATQGYGALILKDAVGRGALIDAFHVGLSTAPTNTGKMEVYNSLCEYCVNGGLGAAGQFESLIAQKVQAYRIGNDGYNIHGTGGTQRSELRDCDGSYNGDVAGESSQGCSAHDWTTMIVKGGRFNYNVSGGHVSVNYAHIELLGDTEWGPILMDRNMRLGNTSGTIASQGNCAWMHNTTGLVSGSVTVSNGQGVGVRVAPDAVVTGANLIISTGNALPNVGV